MYCYILTLPPIKGVVIVGTFYYAMIYYVLLHSLYTILYIMHIIQNLYTYWHIAWCYLQPYE